MRILFLSKRQYMSKDLVDDQYGRFYELPQELARLGHQVSGMCLSYRPRSEGHLTGPAMNGSFVDWYSVNIGRTIIPGLFSYLKKLEKLCRDINPEVIVACSDALHIILAGRVARKLKIPCVADLYDNFESYGLTKVPGILPLFKRSLDNMVGVACISRALKRYVEEHYDLRGAKVLPNAIKSDLFHPLKRRQCRKELGLPLDARLIGTAGALDTSRGIDVLFKAADKLIAEDSSIHLVVAGPLGAGTVLPEGDKILYLGELEHKQVPMLFNSLNVGVICNRDSVFGRYCFPQKVYEMMSCGLSVVAADIGAMTELFAAHPECLYKPDNLQSLVQAVHRQLERPTLSHVKVLTWADLAKELENMLLEVVE